MNKQLIFSFLIFSIALLSCAQSQEKQNPLPACEWCGAQDAPENPDWQIVIPPEDEPGEQLVMRGNIYQPDGKTPAKDIIIYVYHTNAEGIYPKKGDETGNGRRHGYLRGWMKTNDQGKYKFTTIRPAAYPSRNEPAHIHYTISGKDFEEYWLSSVLFEGDPLISEKEKKDNTRDGGFNNIIKLEKDENGVWFGERNIMLEDY